jgi:nucleotide-binding universal stress UspA family protein
MPVPEKFHVLIATDGSTPARAALRTAQRFPWPTDIRVSAVVATDVRPEHRRSVVLAALDRTSEAIASRARSALRRQWPDAAVRTIDASPVEAIVGEARRIRAGAIVIGWRGHGAVRRLVTGSVSRGVIRKAPCAVLVARRAPAAVRRFLIGFDGSSQASHAVRFVAALPPPSGGAVTLVTAVEMMHVLSTVHLAPSARASVNAEIGRINRKRVAQARAMVERQARILRRAGWRVTVEITRGTPSWDLLAAARSTASDVLVVGARGVGGLTRLLLGSVATAIVNRSPVPVLVVP